MNKVEQIAELAFAMALADQMLPQTKTGRLHNLLTKLSNNVLLQFRKLKRIKHADKQKASEIVKAFADLAKWEGKPLHICTKVNFLLALYEDKPHGEHLIPILNEIYDYFARANDAPKACEWSATLALKKWEEVTNATNQ